MSPFICCIHIHRLTFGSLKYRLATTPIEKRNELFERTNKISCVSPGVSSIYFPSCQWVRLDPTIHIQYHLRSLCIQYPLPIQRHTQASVYKYIQHTSIKYINVSTFSIHKQTPSGTRTTSYCFGLLSIVQNIVVGCVYCICEWENAVWLAVATSAHMENITRTHARTHAHKQKKRIPREHPNVPAASIRAC